MNPVKQTRRWGQRLEHEVLLKSREDTVRMGKIHFSCYFYYPRWGRFEHVQVLGKKKKEAVEREDLVMGSRPKKEYLNLNQRKYASGEMIRMNECVGL